MLCCAATSFKSESGMPTFVRLHYIYIGMYLGIFDNDRFAPCCLHSSNIESTFGMWVVSHAVFIIATNGEIMSRDAKSTQHCRCEVFNFHLGQIREMVVKALTMNHGNNQFASIIPPIISIAIEKPFPTCARWHHSGDYTSPCTLVRVDTERIKVVINPIWLR